MEVILLEKMENLGSLGEVVDVAPGYARNYLLPKEKALLATKSNRARFEARRKAYEAHQQELLNHYQALGEQINGTTLQVERRMAEAGRLFGSVSHADIAEALKEQGFEIDRGAVLLPHGSIKEVGEHTVQIRLHPDVTAEITVSVAGI